MSLLARIAAGLQARRLNFATRNVVATCPQCRVVQFPRDAQQELWHPESRPAKYAELYRTWARVILAEATRGSRSRSGHAAWS